jgi:hypothetical protein
VSLISSSSGGVYKSPSLPLVVKSSSLASVRSSHTNYITEAATLGVTSGAVSSSSGSGNESITTLYSTLDITKTIVRTLSVSKTTSAKTVSATILQSPSSSSVPSSALPPLPSSFAPYPTTNSTISSATGIGCIATSSSTPGLIYSPSLLTGSPYTAYTSPVTPTGTGSLSGSCTSGRLSSLSGGSFSTISAPYRKSNSSIIAYSTEARNLSASSIVSGGILRGSYPSYASSTASHGTAISTSWVPYPVSNSSALGPTGTGSISASLPYQSSSTVEPFGSGHFSSSIASSSVSSSTASSCGTGSYPTSSGLASRFVTSIFSPRISSLSSGYIPPSSVSGSVSSSVELSSASYPTFNSTAHIRPTRTGRLSSSSLGSSFVTSLSSSAPYATSSNSTYSTGQTGTGSSLNSSSLAGGTRSSVATHTHGNGTSTYRPTSSMSQQNSSATSNPPYRGNCMSSAGGVTSTGPLSSRSTSLSTSSPAICRTSSCTGEYVLTSPGSLVSFTAGGKKLFDMPSP